MKYYVFIAIFLAPLTIILLHAQEDNSQEEFNYINTYISEFGNSYKENFWSDFTQIFREAWHFYPITRDYLKTKYPDESKFRDDIIWSKENWSEKQKQIYLVYIYEHYQTSIRNTKFPGIKNLTKKQETEVNRLAYTEMAQSHNGFGEIGEYFCNIINMEVDSKFGIINTDWLFTIGKHKADIDNLLIGKLIPSASIYYSGKTFWGIVREQDPNLNNAKEFFIKSNINAIEAHELLYEGKVEMRDLFPELKDKDVNSLYNKQFSNSNISRPNSYETSNTDKLGGITLNGPCFEFKYFSFSNLLDENYCSYRYYGNFEDISTDNSLGLVAEDIFQLWSSHAADKFWVNLHPEEPDRILDKELMNTLSGWILAAADFQLKKDIAWMIFPDSLLGKEYWEGIYSIVKRDNKSSMNEIKIPVTFRVWLVPGNIKVYANEQEIYIHDAEWDVLLENEYNDTKDKGLSKNLTSQEIDEIQDYSTKFFKIKLLPRLKRAINKSDKYSKLRELLYGAIVGYFALNSASDFGG